MTPEITVLLPVYNGERYLREAMESILGQTCSNFEFLLVDDGSTDNSQEIIKSYRDARIRVLVNPRRLKLSGALNRGLDEARGRYIARMDADDIALPERLQRQVEYLNTHPQVGICGTAIEVFGQARRRTEMYPPDSEDIRSYALFDCPFCHPTVMFRKAWFDDHQLRYDGSYYPTEDFELWSRAIELFPSVNLKEVLLRYRVHESSMTGADWDEMDRQAARVIEPLLARMGMACSAEELRFHRNIGRGRSVRLPSLAQVEQAESWLLKLLEKNRTGQSYDEAALQRVVTTVWYRLCINSSQLGLAIVARYRSSVLSAGPERRRRLLMLAGSAMKGKLAAGAAGYVP